MGPSVGDTICGSVRVDAAAPRSWGARAFGPTWRATVEMGRPPAQLAVVDRTLLPSHKDLSRFMAGANALEELRHPGLAPVALVDREAEYCIVAYELPRGAAALGERIEGGQPVPDVDGLARDVVSALAHLHRSGRMHGALGVGTVALHPGGAMLWQHGLAELCDPTRLGRRIGESGVDVVAPEIIAGHVPGPSADVFAWGVVMAETLAQTRGADAIRAVLGGRLGWTPSWLPLVRAALHPEPSGRPADATVLEQAFGGTPAVRGASDEDDDDPFAGLSVPGTVGLDPSIQTGVLAVARPEEPDLSPDTWDDPKFLGVRGSGRAPSEGEGMRPGEELSVADLDEISLEDLGTPERGTPPAPAAAASGFESLRLGSPGGDDVDDTPVAGGGLDDDDPMFGKPVSDLGSRPVQVRATAPHADRVDVSLDLEHANLDPVGPAVGSTEPDAPGEDERLELDLGIDRPAGTRGPGASSGLTLHIPAAAPAPGGMAAGRGVARPRSPHPASQSSGMGRAWAVGLFAAAVAGAGVWVMLDRGSADRVIAAPPRPLTSTAGSESPDPVSPEVPPEALAPAAGDPPSNAPPDEPAHAEAGPRTCPDETVSLGRMGGAVVCIARSEYPGLREIPKVAVTLPQARDLCVERGQRLCTRTEWFRACRGPKLDRERPYAGAHRQDRCNEASADGVPQNLSRAGARDECRTPEGIYDLVGNVSEWVEEGDALGGDATTQQPTCSTSQTLRPNSAGAALGFRCCVTLEPS